MNILITEKTRFIGKSLEKTYKKEYHIFAPSHKELDLFSRNLRMFYNLIRYQELFQKMIELS